MKIWRRLLVDSRGTTLVELLTVLLVGSLAAAATTSAVISMARAERRSVEAGAALNNSRVAMDRVRLELRTATRVYASSSANSISFWSDKNGNGLQDTSEQVTFRLVDTGGAASLERLTAAAPSSPAVIVRALAYPSATDPDVTARQTFLYDVGAPATRNVVIRFAGLPGSGTGLVVTGDVRLRNAS